MNKQDLINTKVRLPTQEIKEKVHKKLLELGFPGNSNVLRDNNAYIFIYGNSLSWQSEDEKYFMRHDFKEIHYTDIISEGSADFSSYKELYEWCSLGKPLYVCEDKYEPNKEGKMMFGGTSLLLNDTLDSYKKSLPKPKEVVLYRHTHNLGGNIYQTCWTSIEANTGNGILLKTETKTVKLEE